MVCPASSAAERWTTLLGIVCLNLMSVDDGLTGRDEAMYLDGLCVGGAVQAVMRRRGQFRRIMEAPPPECTSHPPSDLASANADSLITSMVLTFSSQSSPSELRLLDAMTRSREHVEMSRHSDHPLHC